MEVKKPPKLSPGRGTQTTSTSLERPGLICLKDLEATTSSMALKEMTPSLEVMDKTEYLVTPGMILFVCRIQTTQAMSLMVILHLAVLETIQSMAIM